MPSQPTLALFDLDHTLLPMDSDVAWAEELVRRGVVDAEWHRQRNDHFFAQYKAGTLDIDAFLAFQLGPLAAHPRGTLEAWRAEFFAREIAPRVLPQALALVDQHQKEGALCAIVTATNEFITAPIAKAFGVSHLIATQVETTEQWLATMDLGLESFHASYFYSDSVNDLPLLAKVTHAVAVNPDARLAQHALEMGWPVVDLFASKDAA
jgi:HAD superfamily phosphoserine phosphatase-like hydrolase